MKSTSSFKKITVEIISLLFILLFIYAAVSKLLDYHDFLIQIGKSPILTAYAELAAIGVITFEILTALVLAFRQLRLIGLFMSLSLMTMFSAYITILLLWSPYVPCSCGGILSTLGWHEHLIFNLVFVLLSVIGILWADKVAICKPSKAQQRKHLGLAIIANMFLSIAFIGILYLLSEEKVHRNNGFTRRYPHHPVKMLKGIPVKYNSYYIAGFNGKMIYLGNLTVPSHVLSIDTTLTHTSTHTVQLKNADAIAFSAPRLHVFSGRFYVVDGSAPVIYRGNLSDWTADKVWQGSTKFLQLEPISEDSFIVSGIFKNSTGLMSISATKPKSNSTFLLPKNTDGIFENDGMLLYNKEFQKTLYVYYYKNKYLYASQNLDHPFSKETIDTLQMSRINVAEEDEGIRHTIANHAELLQVQAATSGNYLYIKSRRLGRFEDAEMLRESSIIDVYDISSHTYEFSFYLYNYENEEIKSFEIYGNLLVGLTDHYLVLYQLQSYYFKK